MIITNFLKRNIFLILFFLTSIFYIYGVVYNVVSYIYLCKPFVIIFLILNYFIKGVMFNKLFLIGLFFAFVGDLFYNLGTFDTNLIAMSCFLIFNLILTIIAAEQSGIIKTTKLLLSMLPFILIVVFVIYRFFSNVGEMILLVGIYGFIVALLCSFSLNTFIKKRDLKSLLFFIGALFFITSSICEGFVHFNSPEEIFYLNLFNVSSYILSLLFFSKGLLLKETVKNKDVDLQVEVISFSS